MTKKFISQYFKLVQQHHHRTVHQMDEIPPPVRVSTAIVTERNLVSQKTVEVILSPAQPRFGFRPEVDATRQMFGGKINAELVHIDRQ
jgi:hypothetical protein